MNGPPRRLTVYGLKVARVDQKQVRRRRRMRRTRDRERNRSLAHIIKKSNRIFLFQCGYSFFKIVSAEYINELYAHLSKREYTEHARKTKLEFVLWFYQLLFGRRFGYI